MQKSTMCTKTLIHAAAMIPCSGTRMRFNPRLITNEIPTVKTRAVCLLDIVRTLPSIVATGTQNDHN